MIANRIHIYIFMFASLLQATACATVHEPNDTKIYAAKNPEVSEGVSCVLEGMPSNIHEVYVLEEDREKYFASASLQEQFVVMDSMFDNKTKSLLANSVGVIRERVSKKTAVSEADLTTFVQNVEKNAYTSYGITGCDERYKSGVTIRVLLFDWIHSSIVSSYMLDKDATGEKMTFSEIVFKEMDACYGKVSDKYKIRELVALYGLWKNNPELFLQSGNCNKPEKGSTR